MWFEGTWNENVIYVAVMLGSTNWDWAAGLMVVILIWTHFLKQRFSLLQLTCFTGENCHHCRLLPCSGLSGAALGASAKTRLRIQWSLALLHPSYCWGPSPGAFIPHTSSFQNPASSLCSPCTLLFTQRPYEPKVFSQRLLKYSGTHFRLDVLWKVDPYLSCVLLKPTAHF